MAEILMNDVELFKALNRSSLVMEMAVAVDATVRQTRTFLVTQTADEAVMGFGDGPGLVTVGTGFVEARNWARDLRNFATSFGFLDRSPRCCGILKLAKVKLT